MTKLFGVLMVLMLLLLPTVALASEGVPEFDQIAVEMPETVPAALALVLALIFFDALLGAIVAVREQRFEIIQLPRFLINNVWQWTAVLTLLAVLAHFIGNVFYVFFFTGAAVLAVDYVAGISNKFQALRESFKKDDERTVLDE